MKIKFTILLVLIASICYSQTKGINYKALIKDGSNNVMANQNITVQFIILEGAVNVYQETHMPTTDANGFIIINIGEGSPLSGDYNSVNWAANDHFLNVQIDTGSGLTDMGTTEFKAVPYALNAASKIDDLSDGKSDSDGTDDGSSIFIGRIAGYNDNGTDNKNVGVGRGSLFYNTSGIQNSALGYNALYNNLGYGNTGVGAFSLDLNSTGDQNVAIGNASLFYNTTGFGNTASGASSLFNNNTGNSNLAIGYRAGFNNIDGDLNVFVGYQSGFNETTSDKLYIENSDADADNALIYGEFDSNILRTNSQFQIGNPTLTGFAFPTIDGLSNQILQTDGNGVLSWVDNSTSNASGLEAIDEGNGIGWRLIGRDPANYGNIGTFAVDLSISDVTSSTYGATGHSSAAIGAHVKASGVKSLAIGTDSEASGHFSTAIAGSAATGDYSFAFGVGSKANQDRSIAMGVYSIADGIESTAIGYFANTTATRATAIGNNVSATAIDAFASGRSTIASGTTSTAMGDDTEASGNYATAMGYQSIASGAYATAIGYRAIASNSYSSAIGYNVIVTGDFSTALGVNTTASGQRTLATGFGTLAEAANVTVTGRYNTGGGQGGNWLGTDPLFEIGNGGSTTNRSNALTVFKNGSITAPTFDLNEVTNNKSLITKEYADSNYSGLQPIDEGNGTGWRLTGRNPAYYFNIGNGAVDFSYSTENTITSGGAIAANSTAMGLETGTVTPNSLVIGQYNDNFGIDTILFQIGNGDSSIGKGNAFEINKNGNGLIAGTLFNYSDRRLKNNIVPIKYGLNEVLSLNPVAFNWKNRPEETKKTLGLIAQEVQPIINEIVTVGHDKNQTLSVSYTEFIPVLIKAIQEQQEIIKNQDTKINGLTVELEQLKTLEQRIKLLESSTNSQQ